MITNNTHKSIVDTSTVKENFYSPSTTTTTTALLATRFRDFLPPLGGTGN